MYIYIYTNIHKFMCICTYICTYIGKYIHVYMYVRIFIEMNVIFVLRNVTAFKYNSLVVIIILLLL